MKELKLGRHAVKVTKQDVERFWGNVNKDTPSGCWTWILAKPGKYGVFSLRRNSIPAHRFSYALCVSPIPEKFVVDHVCHNNDLSCITQWNGDCRHHSCVNPNHLEAVSQEVNRQRAVKHMLAIKGCAKNDAPSEEEVKRLEAYKRVKQRQFYDEIMSD